MFENWLESSGVWMALALVALVAIVALVAWLAQDRGRSKSQPKARSAEPADRPHANAGARIARGPPRRGPQAEGRTEIRGRRSRDRAAGRGHVRGPSKI